MIDILLILTTVYIITTAIFVITKAWIVTSNEQKLVTPQEWIVPLFIEYTEDQKMYYAWDISEVFLGQKENKDDLLTLISERFNIPKDKLIIEKETPI